MSVKDLNLGQKPAVTKSFGFTFLLDFLKFIFKIFYTFKFAKFFKIYF